MEDKLEISEKERERRRKISEARRKIILKKREKLRIKGIKSYWRKKKIEKTKDKENTNINTLKKEEKKRKPGRPKKRGRPKQKYKRQWKIYNKDGTYSWKIVDGYSVGKKLKGEFKYKIISCCNGLQNKFIGKYRKIEDAYEELEKLKNNDKNVIFPVESIRKKGNGFSNAINEYIIIEKSDKENTIMRNEYGKLVEQKTNTNGWVVIEKYQYQKEETFWVWGYNNRTDRKTFNWIYDMLLAQGMALRIDFKRIFIYRNKLIIEDANDYIDIIICKTYSDSVRLYNELQKRTVKEKIKQILFVGDYSYSRSLKTNLENKIIEITGWTRKKVQMKKSVYS